MTMNDMRSKRMKKKKTLEIKITTKVLRSKVLFPQMGKQNIAPKMTKNKKLKTMLYLLNLLA